MLNKALDTSSSDCPKVSTVQPVSHVPCPPILQPALPSDSSNAAIWYTSLYVCGKKSQNPLSLRPQKQNAVDHFSSLPTSCKRTLSAVAGMPLSMRPQPAPQPGRTEAGMAG